MRVVCTTVIRNTSGKAVHGHIYEIDWDRQRIRRRIDMPRPIGDRLLLRLNPRGGARGGRGVRITEDAIYAANDNTIIRYDHNWNALGRISNQLLTGIHEIEVVEGGIWAACTGVDLALKLSPSGKVLKRWSPRTSDKIKRMLGVEGKYGRHWPPRVVGWGYLNLYRLPGFGLRRLADRIGMPERKRRPWHMLDEDSQTGAERMLWEMYRRFPALKADNFHLNCVHQYADELYVTIQTWPWREKACIVRVEPDVAVELGARGLSNPHNGQMLDENRLIINDTGTQAVKVFERGTGRLIRSISCSDMGLEGRTWLRGLKQIDGDRILIGVGSLTGAKVGGGVSGVSAQIIELDLNTEHVLKRLVLSHDPNTAPHGLDAIG